MTLPPSPNPLPTTEGVTQTKRVRVTFEGDLVEPGMFEIVQLYFEDGSIGDTIAPYLLRYANIEPVVEGVTQGWPVPDGWKLVPIEPDGNMKRAWLGPEPYDDDARDVYQAMIAAAPLPPPLGQNT